MGISLVIIKNKRKQGSFIFPDNRRIKIDDMHLDIEGKKTPFSIIVFPISREIVLEKKEMNVIKEQGRLKREPFQYLTF
jgi:hypothetical protein